MYPPLRRVTVGLALPLALPLSAGCSPQKDHSGQDSAVEPRASNDAGSPSPDDGDEGTVAEGEACDEAHAKAIRASMDAQCELADVVAPRRMPVVDHPPKAPPLDGVRITVPLEGELNASGRDLTSPMLAQGLTEARERAERLAEASGDASQGEFVLAIEANVPRSRVVSTLTHLHQAGFATGHVLLAATQKASMPEPPDAALVKSITERARALPDDQRAVQLAERLQTLVARCVPAQHAFAVIAEAAPHQKCKLMAAGISEAMVECGCPEQETELLSMIYAVNLPDTDGSMTVTIPVRLDGEARVGDGERWGEIAATLDPGDEPAALGTQP